VHQRQGDKDSGNRDIFTSSDFPGLGGGGRGSSDGKSEPQKPNSNLVGYASALLKKKELESIANADDGKASASAPANAAIEHNEVDSLTRQTQEMEREILSEFHDLSLIGKQANGKDGNQQGHPDPSVEKNESSSQLISSHNLPILPAMAGHVREPSPPPQPPKEPEPVIDVTNSQDFPSREQANQVVGGSSEQGKPTMSGEKPNTPGAWGTRRLFADVSCCFSTVLSSTWSADANQPLHGTCTCR